MVNPYPIALRERAVRAYEDDTASYLKIAEEFEIGVATLQRWVRRARETGSPAPLPKKGGWHSPVDMPILLALLGERPDTTTAELTRAYNNRVAREVRFHRSSIFRALQRAGYVFTRNDSDRPSSTGHASKPCAGTSGAG